MPTNSCPKKRFADVGYTGPLALFIAIICRCCASAKPSFLFKADRLLPATSSRTLVAFANPDTSLRHTHGYKINNGRTCRGAGPAHGRNATLRRMHRGSARSLVRCAGRHRNAGCRRCSRLRIVESPMRPVRRTATRHSLQELNAGQLPLPDRARLDWACSGAGTRRQGPRDVLAAQRTWLAILAGRRLAPKPARTPPGGGLAKSAFLVGASRHPLALGSVWAFESVDPQR